jgi:hypothetical protein
MLVARPVAILWQWRVTRRSSKAFWSPSLWTLSVKPSRSNDLRLQTPLRFLRVLSLETQSLFPSIDTVSKFYPPLILFFTSVNNQQ